MQKTSLFTAGVLLFMPALPLRRSVLLNCFPDRICACRSKLANWKNSPTRQKVSHHARRRPAWESPAFDFKDDAHASAASNLPTSFGKTRGLRMGDLTKPQRDAAMAVVQRR